MGRDFLPRQDVGLVDQSGRTSNPFYIWMQGIERLLAGGATLDEIQAAIAKLQELIDSLPTTGFLPDTTAIFGRGSVLEIGTLAGGIVYLQLINDDFAPGNTFVYSTDATGAKGWHRLYDGFAVGEGIAITDSGYTVLGEVDAPDDLPATGNTGEAWRVLEPAGLYAWDGAAFTLDPAATGIVGFALEPLPDTGIGAALVKITRDGYGRVEGSEAATTDDLPEGSENLYFTDERAQDAVGDVVDGTGDVPLSYNDATGAISAALSAGVQASIALADSAVQPGDNVSSLNNDAGYVNASGAQSAVVAASIVDGDTTHAPSGASVFDALAEKGDLSGGNTWVSAQVFTSAITVDYSGATGFQVITTSDRNAVCRYAVNAGANNVYAGQGTADVFGIGNSSNLNSAANCWLRVSNGSTRHGSDNTGSSGEASARWTVVYAATGAINTSDAREKTPIAAMTPAEIAASADLSREIGTYQWLASIAEKGEDARHHAGITVQRAIEVMQSHGLDPFRYGFICHDEWDEQQEVVEEGEVTQEYRPAGDRYSFRHDELLLFLARGFAARLDAAGL